MSAISRLGAFTVAGAIAMSLASADRSSADSASLTSKEFPDLRNWRYAAGIGVRYYSTFGPIRVDLGVPLNRQKGDGPFAVTVSLGQAF